MFSDDSARNLGLRVGRLFGIDIYLHWILLIIIAIQLLHLSISPVPEGHVKNYEIVFTVFGTFTIALLLSVLLHEFGHAFAAFRQGGSCDRIVLWPLGGLAYCDAPQTPWSQFVVAVGGPVVTVVLAAVSAIVCISSSWPLLPFEGTLSFHELLFQQLFLWNTVLAVVNLIPCYPLDGGRILHTWIWGRTDTQYGSLLRTLNVSRVTAIIACVIGGILLLMGFTSRTWSYDHPFLNKLSLVLIFAAIMYFLTSRQLRQQLMYGEFDEGGAFGYDFSQGYTSLEKAAPREPGPSWRQRRREEKRLKTEERRRQKDLEVRQRLDELLEKISRDGIDSLSPDERSFLEHASKHLRRSEAGQD